MKALDLAIDDARARYTEANPNSSAADENAERWLPGGNTRTVLHFDPFPLTMASGNGAEVTDLDGHRYIDFVGEYSAGLFGHSDERIKQAVRQGLDFGIVMGAPTEHERRLAALLCERYPGIDRVRFCNSGTEANIWALTTARMITGRTRFLAFNGAYHGGFLKFPKGHHALNVPFDFVLADYNDVEGAEATIRQHAGELAAVIVEPILGAGGNISGSQAFMEMLRNVTREMGILLIFDEVKTGRMGPAGMQGLLDIRPDLTTLGKFIGGGLPIGAFGGSADLMALYNPKNPDHWNHAGTFNNDVCTMMAGCVAVGEVYTPQRAQAFLESSEAFRQSLNELFSSRDVPMYANGLGSIIAVHFSNRPTLRSTQITAGCQALRPLLHMELLLQGVSICSRGDFFLSLPMTEAHFEQTRNVLDNFIGRYRKLIIEVLEA